MSAIRPPTLSELQPEAQPLALSLTSWLLQDGAFADDLEGLISGLAAQMGRCGLPLGRINLTLPALHPLYRATNVIWRSTGEVQHNRFGHSGRHSEEFLRSPIRAIFDGELSWRNCRLDDPEQPYAEFPLFDRLRREAQTGYAAFALSTRGGATGVLTLTTSIPGGFSAASFEAIRASLPAFRLIAEARIQEGIAESVSRTYIGPVTGPRVLRGAIHRGSVETLDAVIWFCDLRGFTALSEHLPPEAVAELLNEYFGIVGNAVDREEGEILKFIGDGALAIFPIRMELPRQAAARALRASESALEALAERNRTRASLGEGPLRFGVSLHLGKVSYGNVGALDRLDFTVIGSAVNLAARLEGLCSLLGEPLIASAAFAAASPVALRPLGAHILKGIGAPVEAYGRPAPVSAGG